jgi:hypothetical protein
MDLPSKSVLMEQLDRKSIELWGGIECSHNRVGDEYFDQISRSGHAAGSLTWIYLLIWAFGNCGIRYYGSTLRHMV